MDAYYPDFGENSSRILKAIEGDESYTQDWWQSFAFTRDFAADLGLTRTDLSWLDAVIRHVRLDANGVAKRVFPSQERIAEIMQCCVRTVRRCQAKFEKLGWVLVSKRRARNDQPEGGQWASNYYDLKPLYALHARISAVIKERNERRRKSKAEAGLDRRTPESSRAVGASLMETANTGGLGCPTNKTEPSGFVKNNKSKSAEAKPADKRSLTDDEQAVLSQLKALGYDEKTGRAHIRKHGADRAKQVMDAVTKWCSGVKDVARMINHYMTRPLPSSYVKDKEEAWERREEGEKQAQSVACDMLPPVPTGVDVEAARAEFAALPQHERNTIVETGRSEARHQCRDLDSLDKAERDERISRFILLEFLNRKA